MGALRQVEWADPLQRRQRAGLEAVPRKYDFLAADAGRRSDRRCFCQNAAFEKTAEYPELDLPVHRAGDLLRVLPLPAETTSAAMTPRCASVQCSVPPSSENSTVFPARQGVPWSTASAARMPDCTIPAQRDADPA